MYFLLLTLYYNICYTVSTTGRGNKMKTYLYIRVSTDKQDYDRQLSVLSHNGYTGDNSIIVTETFTGKTLKGRKKFNKMNDNLKEGDTVVIESISRLARSLEDLLSIINDFNQRGIFLKSIKEDIDMTTANGKLIVSVLGAFIEFERNITSERTKEKLRSLKEQGVELGRPKVHDHEEIYALHKKGYTYREIRDELGMSLSTISNAINKFKTE